MTMDLATKYRPDGFDDVYGHESIIKSLRAALDDGSRRAFLFAGPSGVGKTTLARILAAHVGCVKSNVVEINAANHTGVDAMRDLAQLMLYSGLGKSGVRVVILDEAHMLSKAAWNSLLKPMEEPPKHAYWILCTTEPGRVPPTIKTRCSEYTLNAVRKDDIYELLDYINDEEKFEVPEDVLSLIAAKCGGSPRRGISFLSVCRGADSRKEAAELIKEVEESDPVRKLCSAMMKGDSWKNLMRIIGELDDVDPESVRYQVCEYFGKVAMSAKTEQAAEHALAVLDAFSTPYPQGSRTYALVLSVGAYMLG